MFKTLLHHVSEDGATFINDVTISDAVAGRD